ncbi:MAG: alpha/beta fold hydrolase [Gammaproteobacteria bacterium]|nr:alpha/beta fold hydrolase [Gammaproteobacteria bacterium]
MRKSQFSDGFVPPAGMRNAHLQSVLASLRVRWPFIRRRARDLLGASRKVIVHGDDGVRLNGYYTSAAPNAPMVVLIHGWEGSAHSQYIISAAALLHDHGYAVFRLQLRDHGDSHHLNPEVFHSCRLEETAEAVRQIRRRFHPPQLFLGGFSLGGNFALRIARHAPQIGLELDGVCAISPVIDPAITLRHMQEGPTIYQGYFMKKWRRSLRRKNQFYPDALDISLLSTHRNLLELTEVLVETIGGFDSVADYFDGYSVKDERLHTITIPAAILAASDDPIVPDEPLQAVKETDHLRIFRTRHGGHCGFLTAVHRESYADQFMVNWFNNARAKG